MRVRKIAALGVVAATGVLLLTLILRHALPAYLAYASPELALRFQPEQPDALLALAAPLLEPRPAAPTATHAEPRSTEALAFARDDIGLALAEHLAEQAALTDPLNARAFRLLGDVAARQGNEPRALALMTAAAHRSLHESGALLALLKGALVRGDYAEAAYDIDALLRVHPRTLPHLAPALAAMSERAEARPFVVKLIEANPPWREPFFELAPRSVANIHTPGDLLLGLQDTATPATRSEAAAYLWFLVDQRLYEDAYGYWVQFLSAEELDGMGLLFNGDFRRLPSGQPFDWEVRSGLGYTAEVIAPTPQSNEHGLVLRFSGTRAQFRPISHLLMLTPGEYTLKGQWRGDLTAKRGLSWQVSCVEAEAVAGRSEPFHSGGPDWTAFQSSISIPAVSCPAQRLSLLLDARSQSETMLEGSISFSDLQIVRQ